MSFGHYTDLLDIAKALLLIFVIYFFTARRRIRNEHDASFRYLIPSLHAHLLGGIAFAIFYMIIGGDTQGYYDGAISLRDLFYRDPFGYLEEFAQIGDNNVIFRHFSSSTGFPPVWIYHEPESWMVCKLYSIPAIFGISGYLTLTVFTCFLSHTTAFALFRELKHREIFNTRWLAFAMLMIPSVLFWTSGVNKDTLIGIGVNLSTLAYFRCLRLGFKFRRIVLLSFVCLVFLIAIRKMMFVVVILAILYSLTRYILKSTIRARLLRSFITGLIVISIGGITLFLFSGSSGYRSETVENLLREAQVTHSDFTQNQTYGQNRYKIEVEEYTAANIILSMPAAVTAGLYRPFLWEALTPSLFLNGLESMVLIFLTIRFFFLRRSRKQLGEILSNEILSYLLISCVIIAFMTGFSSILFGVLVRVRSFALPFLVALLSLQMRSTLESIPPSGKDVQKL